MRHAALVRLQIAFEKPERESLAEGWAWAGRAAKVRQECRCSFEATQDSNACKETLFL